MFLFDLSNLEETNYELWAVFNWPKVRTHGHPKTWHKTNFTKNQTTDFLKTKKRNDISFSSLVIIFVEQILNYFSKKLKTFIYILTATKVSWLSKRLDRFSFLEHTRSLKTINSFIYKHWTFIFIKLSKIKPSRRIHSV